MAARIPVAIYGAAGRMGRRVLAQVLATADLELVAALVRPDSPAVGRDAGELAGEAPCGLAARADLGGARPRVVIDFSTASAVPAAAQLACGAGAALLACTTGLDATARAALDRASERVAVLESPNTSLGVSLLIALVEQVARALGEADVELVEMHHRHKVDAPSGTALALARAIARGRGLALEEAALYGRRGRYEGGRPRGEIGIHTLRGGDVTGEHTAIFALGGERLELVHKASSRDVFAAGALRAARFLAEQPPGRYTMAQVLGLGQP